MSHSSQLIKENIAQSQPTTKTSEVCLEPCAIERGMRLIGGKWKGSILWHLQDGPVRFNELCRQIGGASKKMIDQRLKEMEELGLVKRKVLSERPISVSYEATDLGLSALGVLDLLKDWTESYETSQNRGR